jgi:diadenosine tetraphosphatase ApaH/serine/threonine PP2A family protein phosphatase
MRYLVISDVHANLEALEAVLHDADEYEGVLCLGDLIGYGPDPNAVVDCVRELPNLICLVGNHDLAALGEIDVSTFNAYAREAAEWTRDALRPDVKEYLAALSPREDADTFTLAHASPRNPVWEYLESLYQAGPNFGAFSSPYCLVGHTHVPRIFVEAGENGDEAIHVVMPEADDVIDMSEGGRWIINPGGVGQPRNGDPRAAYGILDADAQTFVFRRVVYPVDVTQRKIRDAGLPSMLASRLRLGL